MLTNGQIMAEYHKKMLRIPHGAQHPKKRYLTDQQILDVFDGEVWIQEKVDGKLSIEETGNGELSTIKEFTVHEDMTGKNTVHRHVMEYSNLPPNKRIILDRIIVREINENDCELIFHPDGESNQLMVSFPSNILTYAKLRSHYSTMEEIHTLLEAFSKMDSHFGSAFIEGLVIKNYGKQLMAKWVNDAFEDELYE